MVCSDGRLNECMTWEMKVIDNSRPAFYLKLTSLSIIVIGSDICFYINDGFVGYLLSKSKSKGD